MTQLFNITQWARDYGQREAQASTIPNLTKEQRTQLAHRLEYGYKVTAQKLCGLITLVTAIAGFILFKPLLIVAGLSFLATRSITKSIDSTGVLPACLNRLLPAPWYEANHPARTAYLRAYFGLPAPVPVVASGAPGVSGAPATTPQPAEWEPESFSGLWKNSVPIPTTTAGFGVSDPEMTRVISQLSESVPFTPQTMDDIIVTLIPTVLKLMSDTALKDVKGIWEALVKRGVDRQQLLNLLEQKPEARRAIVTAMAEGDVAKAIEIYQNAVAQLPRPTVASGVASSSSSTEARPA